MYNHTMERIERLEAEGKIFVIRPEIELISRIERDMDKLTGFYRHGYEQMDRQYQALIEYPENNKSMCADFYFSYSTS